MSVPLLEVIDLHRRYRLPREHLLQRPAEIEALAGVDLVLEAGRSLGIVGESGSGKSTLARAVMGIEQPTQGSVRILGQDISNLDRAAMRQLRRNFQMVFQDPYGSLDPRQKVARIIAEPLTGLGRTSARDARAAVDSTLEQVGLRPTDAEKYPREFSGGQRQRIAIARALITRPKLIVADEAVSALDVSVQAQVLNLFQELRNEFGVTYLFISHDLAVVDHVCDEVAVIFQGRIVEQGPPSVLFAAAAHPYTRALIAAVPRLEPRRRGREVRALVDGAGSADAIGKTSGSRGCPYAQRCWRVESRCLTERPLLRPIAPDHRAACHFAEAILCLGDTSASSGARA